MSNRKDINIGVPAEKEVRADFKKASRLRGATMATLLRQFIMQVIYEEKERHPEAFGLESRVREPKPMRSITIERMNRELP